MTSDGSKVSVVAVPGLGDVWPSGQESRLGTVDDADAVAQWRSDTVAVNGALKDAVEALRNGSSETMVYVVEDAQVPIGVLMLGWKAPYLQLVFIDEPYRRGDVGTKATCVVVDEFFQSRPEEQWLGVTKPISAAGKRLLLRLGFSSSGSGMRITRDAWEAVAPAIALFFAPDRASDPALDDGSTTAAQEDDDAEVKDVPRVAIDARKLHIVTNDDARALFQKLLGTGPAWTSGLMQYRTTSSWQDDWVIEVGNWLARADALGYLAFILRNVLPYRSRAGGIDQGDEAHKKVSEWLAQAMVSHYFLGIGWRFGAFEPTVSERRASDSTKPADVDLQLYPPSSTVLVDMQVKANGRLGRPESQVDPLIRGGVTTAIKQLPVPAARPALVVMCAQRWPLSGETHVLETMIGSTLGYPDGRVLLHDDAYGELAKAPHVSGIAMLDYRRGATVLDYGCSVLMNPWATYPLDPEWFPHSRVLSCADGVFSWIRGAPDATYFPTGTRFAPGPRGSAL